MLRPFLLWCQQNQIQLKVSWVPSREMLADKLSRWVLDRQDYQLDPHIFQKLQKIFLPHIQPDIDMFASPGNTQLPKFVARWPHWQAWGVDALHMDLSKIRHFHANPPWNLAYQWLIRLYHHPHIQCLTILPYWVGTNFWPLLVRLHDKRAPQILINLRE